MNINRRRVIHSVLVLSLIGILTITASRMRADTGTCGGQLTTVPFTDVMSSGFFCQIAEAYFSGLANGTTATTYSPTLNVTRDQMAAFVTRTMDQSIQRGSRRAALQQFWNPQAAGNFTLTTVGNFPGHVKSDGADLWVANGAGTVSRVRGSDGKLLETFTGASGAFSLVVAMGKVFVMGLSGTLYQIDPTTSGAVTTVTGGLGNNTHDITFDGQRIWTSNNDSPGSVSIVSLSPLTVTNKTAGLTSPDGILFDGANIWVTDVGDNKLKKLDSSGNVILSVTVGSGPEFMAFDGTNLWVPNNFDSTVSVVRAKGGLSGTVLATLSGNGLVGPRSAAFDGERILVTNQNGNSVSLWKASDFTPIGTFSTGSSTGPDGACSDGVNFWIVLGITNKLGRF